MACFRSGCSRLWRILVSRLVGLTGVSLRTGRGKGKSGSGTSGLEVDDTGLQLLCFKVRSGVLWSGVEKEKIALN